MTLLKQGKFYSFFYPSTLSSGTNSNVKELLFIISLKDPYGRRIKPFACVFLITNPKELLFIIPLLRRIKSLASVSAPFKGGYSPSLLSSGS